MTDDDGLDALVDREALRGFLESELGPADAFAVERHDAGFSNETLFVTWGERDLVLRRPPAGETPEGAHDVLREARFVRAVAGTVPVPEVVATAEAGVLECPFFLMERLAGDVLRNDEPPRFATPEARRRVGEELVDVLAAIHGVDVAAAGLRDVGDPDTYLERQVSTWRGQMEEWLLPTTETERAVPGVYEVADRLAELVPEPADRTLVHGDYKLDNVLFGPGADPEIAGVLDWELATRGDPLADLGWMLVFWPNPDDPDAGVPEGFLPRFTAREGYPTRGELVARYEHATGTEYEDDRFYRGFAAYKIAAACEAMYYRHLAGDADTAAFAELRDGVPAMVRRARRILDGGEPL